MSFHTKQKFDNVTFSVLWVSLFLPQADVLTWEQKTCYF